MSTQVDKAIEIRLQELCDANSGVLLPDHVVTDARDPKSPLHSQFEWDDSKAAAKHRLDQARTLIRTVSVITRSATVVVRTPMYVRDPRAPGNEQGYMQVTALRTDEDLAREAAVNELTRARQYLERAKNIAKALQMDGEFEQLLAGVVDISTRVAGGASALN